MTITSKEAADKSTHSQIPLAIVRFAGRLSVQLLAIPIVCSHWIEAPSGAPGSMLLFVLIGLGKYIFNVCIIQ